MPDGDHLPRPIQSGETYYVGRTSDSAWRISMALSNVRYSAANQPCGARSPSDLRSLHDRMEYSNHACVELVWITRA